MTVYAENPGAGGSTPGVSPQRRRRWAKTDATQQRILDAATRVFRDRGYSTATISEVVAASGASIGSIYHHFGGKNELFVAIYEHMAADVQAQISLAEPTFDAQVRAYLEAVWAHRATAIVLSSDDVPPGFERIYRDGIRGWLRNWMTGLDLDQSARGELLTRVIVALLTESAEMMMVCETPTEAEPLITAALGFIARLTA